MNPRNETTSMGPPNEPHTGTPLITRRRRAGTRALTTLGVAALTIAGLVPQSLSQTAGAASAIKAPPPGIVKLLPSPYSDGAQAPSTFTGDAAEWAVGIVTTNNEALVYLCDGRNVGQWFGARIANGALTGTAPNGSVVKASLKAGSWTGTVSLKGKPVPFTAKAATAKNGWGVWRVKPSPFDGPDFVVGWISSENGVRGIAQTPTGKVASGVVATVSTSGQLILNGSPVAVPANVLPTTTIVGVVQSAQVAPGGSTVPPDPTKLCIGKMIAHAQAYRAYMAEVAESEENSDPIDPAYAAALREASVALNKCQTGQ